MQAISLRKVDPIGMVYGYCRISNASRPIAQQEKEIKKYYPDAIIINEEYDGVLSDNKRYLFLKTLIKRGDTLILTDITRLAGSSDKAFEEYSFLLTEGVVVVFIHSPYLNTDAYKNAFEAFIMRNEPYDEAILLKIKECVFALINEQINLTFKAIQRISDFRSERTKEGIVEARKNGKQIGGKPGKKLNIKKAGKAKAIIRQFSVTFGGDMNDTACAKLAGVSRNTFYKYKREIIDEELAKRKESEQ
jgi:DNA invertase Pin-like site-specific DNA recombinase